MKACRELFDEGGYDAVSFRTIGEKTSFSRPSIYNYYGTKEEVFLDLISQEYAGWREGIEAIRENGTPKTREEYASATTDCLRSHDRLTRLMSIHYTAISHNCSLDRLKAFQKTIQPFFDSFASLLHDTFPDSPQEKQDQFRVLYFSLISGLYPLTHLTDNQKAAMKYSAPAYDAPDFFDILYIGTLPLTQNL